MAEARILVTGEAIRITGMFKEDFLYSKYGSIFGFKYLLTTYRHFVDKSRGVDSGYYDYNRYLDFVASGNREKPADLIPFDLSSFKVQDKDVIRIYQRDISPSFLNVCWYTYEFNHIEGKDYGSYQKIILPSDAKLIPDPAACEHEWIAAKDFYNNFVHKAISVGDSDFSELLADIQQIIEYIEQNIFSILFNDVNYKSLITNQRNLWRDNVTYDFATKDEYVIYRSVLNAFGFNLQSHRKKIGNDSILVLIYLAAIMSSKAIEDLLLEVKLKMLLRLATKGLDNWQIFYKIENDQSVVVKIVKSITANQADDFLSALLDGKKYGDASGINLFELFYAGLSDKKLGLGKENLKNYIFAMYVVWAASSNNPYQNGVFSSENLAKFTYNNQIATNPDPGNPFWKDILDIDNKAFNFHAAPIILNYISNKFIGIYLDNFKFFFTKNIQLAVTDFTEFKDEFWDYNNLEDIPKGKILAVQDNYRDSGESGLYGTYDYYQPVSILDSNQEAIMKIPVINGNDETVIDGQSEKINSLIPIFVLKYIDDTGDESDITKVLGYSIDIASIFLGGYGIVTKLKYLRTLSGFTEAVIAGSEFGDKLIFRLYLSTAALTINVTAGTVSFLLKLTGDAYKDQPWYKNLTNTIIWIEILSAGGSVLADKLLKASAKNLVTDFNALPNGWPAEFVDDTRGVLARQTLTEMSGLATDVIDTLLLKYKPQIIENVNERVLGNAEFELKKIVNGVITTENLHTEADLYQIIRTGFEDGLPVNEIRDLLYISYRKKKQIASLNLIEQIKTWVNVKNIRLYPFRFNNFEEYSEFKTNFKELVEEWSLPIDDIRVQGSSIRTSSAADIDIAIIVDEETFQKYIREDILARYKISFTDIETGKLQLAPYQNAVKRLDQSFRTGRLSSRQLGLIISQERSFSQELYFKNIYPKGESIDISIIIKNGSFDLSPYLKF